MLPLRSKVTSPRRVIMRRRIAFAFTTFLLVFICQAFARPSNAQGGQPQTPTPESACRNLLGCSNPVPVFIPNSSTCTAAFTAQDLVVTFNNNVTTSGIAFVFSPALGTREARFVELRATSTYSFVFVVEYKVRGANGLNIVKTSRRTVFPATSTTRSRAVRIPMRYVGAVDEIVINFIRVGQTSSLVINSLQLK
jgi:hypothetical protein